MKSILLVKKHLGQVLTTSKSVNNWENALPFATEVHISHSQWCLVSPSYNYWPISTDRKPGNAFDAKQNKKGMASYYKGFLRWEKILLATFLVSFECRPLLSPWLELFDYPVMKRGIIRNWPANEPGQEWQNIAENQVTDKTNTCSKLFRIQAGQLLQPEETNN